MYSAIIKPLFALLSCSLVLMLSDLMLGDRAVHAQTFEPNGLTKMTASLNQTSIAETMEAPSSIGALTEVSAEPSRSRVLRNYVGIGGNIGIRGTKTGLAEGGAAILMKTDLSDALSIRGVNAFGRDRTDNTVALTINFPVRTRSGQVILVPFVGGGALLSSRYNLKDFIVRGLVTGGVDIPLSQRFTATTSVNVGFTDKANIGVQLGVAYNF